MVVNAKQVKSIVSGENGLLEKMKPGSIIIITATIGQKGIKDVEVSVKEKGIKMIDCCVSGGRYGSVAGTIDSHARESIKIRASRMGGS